MVKSTLLWQRLTRAKLVTYLMGRYPAVMHETRYNLVTTVG